MPEIATAQRVRLFIAVKIPEEVKAELERTQQELRRDLTSGALRWTHPGQFHLTLKFLGSVQCSSVEALTSALHDVCAGFAPLRLKAQEAGFFPNGRSPRVLWVGISDEERQLPRLQEALEAATLALTTERPEGRFSAHVTLARIKSIQRSDAETLARLVGRISERVFGEWTAGEVELMQSELLASGAKYTVVAKSSLVALA